MSFQTYQANNRFVLVVMYTLPGGFTQFRRYIEWCKETFDKDDWEWTRPDVITLHIIFNSEEHRSFFLLKWTHYE